MKDEPVNGFDIRSLCRVAMASDTTHIPSLRRLSAQYRAGAERISAVHRQAVIQYVQDTRHRPTPYREII